MMTNLVYTFGKTGYLIAGKSIKCLFPFRNECVSVRKLSNIKMEGKKEIYMIVGLGNHDMPRTRHSVGMELVNRLALYLGITLKKDRSCLGHMGMKELANINLVLLKPTLAMNLNGRSVQKAASFYKVPYTNIYAVHDELDKHVGKFSIKEKGSASGHNGVKSVIQCLKTEDFPRLRIGIDRPVRQDMVGDYVLKKFTDKERTIIDDTLDHCVVRLAEHIGGKVTIPAAQVFKQVTETDVHDRVTQEPT